MYNHVVYLTPMERTTKVYGREHSHYVVATPILKKWKDKTLKITIEPAKGFVKKFAQVESRSWETVDK